MSSVGQAVGGIVGAVVGFFTPLGPIYGAQIGMMVGGVLDPPRTEGPRLEDLTAQTSVYGAFIPRLYGTTAVTGNVIWIQGDKLIERSVESDGKGGPVVTNFEYFATFAVGLCEGPIDGVRRIWIGGQLWYDAGSDDLSTIIASNENAGTFTLYTGTDTQLADPLIQADRGAANVPAYRGLAYIVFDELPLKDYGNSLVGAQVKVEVVKSASYGNFLADSWYMPAEASWHTTIRGGGNPYDDDGFSNFVAFVSSSVNPQWVRRIGTTVYVSDISDTSDPLLSGGPLFPAILSFCSVSLDSSNYAFAAGGDGRYFAWGAKGAFEAFNTEVAYPTFVTFAEQLDTRYLLYKTGLSYWLSKIGDIGQSGSGRLTAYSSRINLYPKTPTVSVWGDYAVCAWREDTPDDQPLEITIYGEIGGSLVLVDSYSLPFLNEVLVWNDGINGHEYGASVYDDKLYIVRGNMGGAALEAPVIVVDLVTRSLVGRYRVPNALPAVTSSQSPAVRVVGGLVHYGVRSTLSAYAFEYNMYQINRLVDDGDTTLSSIVESECLQSGLLTAGDLDVTELTDQVRGYRVSSLSPLRGGIDQLRKAWPFDAIQHGYKILFKKRGGASVATITEGELDARAAGANPGVRISNVREMDLIMPQQLTVQYMDATREYDVNVAEESR